MHIEPRRSRSLGKLVLAAIAGLALLTIVWHFQSPSQSSGELRNLGESVTSAINTKDFARLERLLGNPVAVETIRSDVGNELVQLGQIAESNSEKQCFTVVTSGAPKKEIVVYLSKDESGSWWANIP